MWVRALIVAAVALQLYGQEDIPAGGRGGRGGRGGTREFLGLGPAPEPGRRRDSMAPAGVIVRMFSTKSSI